MRIRSPAQVTQQDEATWVGHLVSLSHREQRQLEMKLSYRGVKYQTAIPTIATSVGNVIGKDRGIELWEQVRTAY